MATVHPSSVLRGRMKKHVEGHRGFEKDLRAVKREIERRPARGGKRPAAPNSVSQPSVVSTELPIYDRCRRSLWTVKSTADPEEEDVQRGDRFPTGWRGGVACHQDAQLAWLISFATLTANTSDVAGASVSGSGPRNGCLKIDGLGTALTLVEAPGCKIELVLVIRTLVTGEIKTTGPRCRLSVTPVWSRSKHRISM